MWPRWRWISYLRPRVGRESPWWAWAWSHRLGWGWERNGKRPLLLRLIQSTLQNCWMVGICTWPGQDRKTDDHTQVSSQHITSHTQTHTSVNTPTSPHQQWHHTHKHSHTLTWRNPRPPCNQHQKPHQCSAGVGRACKVPPSTKSEAGTPPSR